MSKFFQIVLSVMLLAIAKADDDFALWRREFEPEQSDSVTVRNVEDRVYRLPENVIPLDYNIYIDLFFEERTEKPYSYEGTEYIIIQAVETNVTEVVLHANVDRINRITLNASETNVPVRLNSSSPFTIESEYHFLKVNLAETLIPGINYTLFIDYSGSMNEGPMKRGIWRGWYSDGNGQERIYAATHFQPYNARQAFPCWDEPLFKSVFKFHLTKAARYNGTFSNTGVQNITYNDDRSRAQHEFQATPKMSSYLVTFLVSETFMVIAQNTTFTPPIRIIGRSNTNGLGGHALELAVGMTEFYDEYFQMPYSSLHPNLMNDHVSSPDWASAGTENWGMVSYRELHLIVDPRETIMSVEHYSATLVSHELVHKWFGNLITCYWWSNTWINEGFASYFGYIGAHAVFPKYELDDHFNTRYLQTSLGFDSGASSVPMNYDVNTPAQVTGHFGTISYSKGAAFLRMTVDIISESTFRKVCQYFLRDNMFEPTNQYDLYDAFKRAIDEDNSLQNYGDFDFEEYYRIWVNEAGYPILEIEVDHTTGNVNLKQERFYLNANLVPTGIYPIPITYTTRSSNNFNNLTPVKIMNTTNDMLTNVAANEWVIFNNLQHGHYRVNYDDRTWQLISEALLTEPNTIHFLNRAQIVDDVFAYMRSGRMTHNYGFNILRFLESETNFHVWDPAISGYTWLRNRLRHLPESQAEFDAHVLSYLQHAIDELGFSVQEDETPTVSMARQNILHFACNLGHSACVRESKNRFANMRAQIWVDPRLRRSVYVTGVREGNSSDFSFLFNRFNDSNFANDKLEMLRGLGATRDPNLLTQYLDLTITMEVRSHDKVNSFNYALLGNQENAVTVLDYVKTRVNDIRVAYVEDSPARPVHTALSNLAAYLDEEGLDDYEEWASTQTDLPQYSSIMSAIRSSRSNIAWGTANADLILQAVRGGATAVVTSVIMVVAMTMFAMIA